MKKLFKPSGNKIIDNFIKYTQVNLIKVEGKMEFVPHDQFKNIEFIAEGGFSKIYKATWISGPIDLCVNRKNMFHQPNYTVVLKKLNNSKNITSKELNELKIFYNYYTKWKTQFDNNWAKRRSKKISYQETQDYSYISNYFGITQDLNTQDFMIIMVYYEGEIIHRDLHSGNIFFNYHTYIGDLGMSKSATESTDNDENYGIIPYMAPEIFRGQKYTKASDIYSFGMIMWEFMT
ncbi:kinase-like protein, partial [Rhizophagus irregularis]